MLKAISIKSLYPPALAEGEGVGTAYEYFAKRLALGRWLKRRPPLTGRLLIAGLPQKYGASLDFFLLAEELGLTTVVVDERPAALAKAQAALAACRKQGLLTGLESDFTAVADLSEMAELEGSFALALASEVLQRLPASDRASYGRRLTSLANSVALFAPNADNPGHTSLSGLSGVGLAELQALFAGETAGRLARSGYIDMPPFPPGMTRSDEQREQATSGRFEALAMWGLGWYARLEGLWPAFVRRRQAHIVYGFWERLGSG